MKKFLTSVLLVSSIFYLYRRETDNTKKDTIAKDSKAICKQQSAAPSFFNNYNGYIVEYGTTPVVTEQHIEKFIFGSQNVCHTLTTTIKSMLTDHQLANYVEFVFTHSEGFKITVYPIDKVKNNIFFQPEIGAQYLVFSNTLILYDNLDYSKVENFTPLRHEIRHGAVSAIEKILGVQSSIDSGPQRAKFEEMLKLGDNRVLAIRQILIYQGKKYLPLELQDLRNSIAKKYIQNYKSHHILTISQSSFNQLEKIANRKLKIGDIYNFDNYTTGEAFGDYVIDSIQNNSEKIEVRIAFLDPLYALINLIPFRIQQVKDAYAAKYYISERDAYLHGEIPQEFIEYFYYEFNNGINELIEKAKANNRPYHYYLPEYLPYDEVIFVERLGILRDPKKFNSELAKNYIAWCRYAYSIGKYHEAQTGLLTLIQKGFFVTDANLNLARMAFLEKEFELSAKHYKRAEKREGKLNAEDRIIYSEVLAKIGFNNHSKKQVNKAYKSDVGEATGFRQNRIP